MDHPKIPDNSLTERIKTIIELIEELVEDSGKDSFEFDEPMSNEEIEAWEKENDIKIPASYKEWLNFTRAAEIYLAAAFYEPSDFVTDNDQKPCDVPDECVVIGELGGWGVSVCFYAETGEIMYIDHGEECRDLDFGDILDWVIDRLQDSM